MVNKEELRNGNLVNYNGDVYPVSTIGMFGISGKSKESAFISKYNNMHLSGIPLTFEWLRKFRFELNDIGEDPTETEKRYRHAYKGSFGIEFDTQKGTFTLHNVVGELVEYQYVHHLQNVYYWNTMKELEIKDLDPQNVHKIS